VTHPVRIGKYEDLEEIGRGGFAIVYKAWDPKLERNVALKVLHPYWTADHDFVVRFRREARTAARLRHSHIVTIYEADEVEGQPYIAMEYLPGYTLESLLQHEELLSFERVLSILEQVAEALDYAHSQSIVHRDVKPSNVMVEEAEHGVQAKLMDFGLVKAVAGSSVLTSQGKLLGSPEYMAPEQADPKRTDEIGPATDRYALGIVAYQMLTGRVPFPGNEPGTLNAHLNLDPPDPQGIREDLPPAVAATLLKMLAKAPGDRFASAHAFVVRLREALLAKRQEYQRRRIDAAVPSHAKVGQSIDLLVQVRFPDSPLLGIENWPTRQKPPTIEQASEPIAVQFPIDYQTGKPASGHLEIEVEAPYFQIAGATRQIVEVPPDQDSKRVLFLLTAKKSGKLRINVKVYSVERVYLGVIPVVVKATAVRKVVAPSLQVATLVLIITVGRDASVIEPDIYSPLESGLQQLLKQLLSRVGQHHPDYSTALVLQHRLTQNIAETRLYRDTNDRASERAQIIHQLNNLALSALGIPFNELCKPAIPTTRPEPAELLRRDSDVLKSQARKGLSRRQRWVLVMSVIVIGLFGVFALGWTIGWGPAASLFWTETPPVTLTTATTPVPTVTLTLTATLAPTATQVLTPDVRTTLLILIETEKRAVLIEDMDLIRAIFAPDATKTDAATNLSWNAIQRYTQTFTREDHLEITHANLEVTIAGDKATVTNDSCGSFMVTATRQKIEYNCPQCDRWTFHRDANGRWWITDMTYNLVSNASSHRYTFEDGTHGCWTVRYDRNKPQGGMPTLTTELAHLGQGALRFAFDLARISTHRAQTIRYNMPFAGQASAYVYAPPDAPANLEAGFFAMELDHAPFNYHEANQMVRLDPGKWTRITWNIGVTGWVQPLHLLGIEVRQTSGGTYSGYVCIDDVSIKSQ